MAIFVDANVFLRFFTHDDAGQHDRAARLFERATGNVTTLVTGPPVLFEVAWTLRSAYRLDAKSVLDVLEAILAFPGLKLTDAEVCAEALRLARAGGVDFADAYIAALATSSEANMETCPLRFCGHQPAIKGFFHEFHCACESFNADANRDGPWIHRTLAADGACAGKTRYAGLRTLDGTLRCGCPHHGGLSR